MPTNRKVIDFKIHNLTEEQFQELKEAGQIDPNAIYCTPDETVANFEAVNARIDETNKKLNTFESGVNETVGVINTTIVNVDKKVDEAIQTEQQHNIEINARVDETVANFEEINAEIEALKDKGGIPLLTPMWTDHALNDMSWLNADTFSWQSGDVYVAAYEHLANEYTEAVNSGAEVQSDTVAGITVHYIVASDGHKICHYLQEENVQALYEKTGVAWYYILDTFNKQFKLPRTKHTFTGLRDEVGKYVPAGLPNITGEAGYYLANVGSLGVSIATGAFAKTGSEKPPTATKTGTESTAVNTRFDFNASRSSSVYGNSNTVQPPATQMYLYFYVGNFEREALEQTAGITSEQLNNKADVSDVAELQNNKLDKSAEISLVPTGSVTAFAGTTPPTGWLKCDGSAISRTTYAKLFAAIGGNYGTGDGSTTFNLPNLIGRVPFGMTAEYIGQSSNGVLPNITATWFDYDNGNGYTSPTGAIYQETAIGAGAIGSGYNFYKRNTIFDAARSNSMYGNGWYSGSRVIPSSVGMTYCIKY